MENTKNTKDTIPDTISEEATKKHPEEMGEKEPKKKEKEEQKKKGPMEKEISPTTFLFLLIPSIIKDSIEIILGIIVFIMPVLAPIIIFLSFIICLPFSAFIFAITILSDIRATWLFAGLIIDQIPGLPAATLTVILCYIFQKLPASAKKIVEKASELTSLKPLETKI